MTIFFAFKIAVLLAVVAVAMCAYLAVVGFVAAAEYERNKKKWGRVYDNRKPEASFISVLWPITIPYLGFMFVVLGIGKLILRLFSNPISKGIRFFYWLLVDEPTEAEAAKKEIREDLPKARVINQK